MSPPNRPIDVEISVVNHQRLDLTRACLHTLPSACDGLSWHATIVDNASGDGSAEAIQAEFPDVEVLPNRSRQGFGFNQNQVITRVLAAGSARFVLAVNNDTELAPGSVGELVALAGRDPGLGAVGPRTLNTDGTTQPSSFRFPSLAGAAIAEVVPGAAPLGCTPAEEGRIWLGGACLLLRAEALRATGGFDTRFFLFFEDIDLAKRLWEAGWASALCPAASMVHHNHQTVTRDDLMFPMACQLRRSYFLYIDKHYGRAPAVALDLFGRAALLARAAKARVSGMRSGDRSLAALASHLRGLGLYNPRNPLPHEVVAG